MRATVSGLVPLTSEDAQRLGAERMAESGLSGSPLAREQQLLGQAGHEPEPRQKFPKHTSQAPIAGCPVRGRLLHFRVRCQSARKAALARKTPHRRPSRAVCCTLPYHRVSPCPTHSSFRVSTTRSRAESSRLHATSISLFPSALGHGLQLECPFISSTFSFRPGVRCVVLAPAPPTLGRL